MAWVKLEDTFCDHPKFRRLARTLGVSVNAASGMCARLWSWAIRCAPDGDLSSYCIEDIAYAAGYENTAVSQRVIDGLVEAGLLDRTEHGLSLHDWMDRAGSYKEARRVSRWRERQREDFEATLRNCNVTVTEQRRGEERRGDIYIRGEDTPRHEDLWSDRVHEVYAHYRTYHPRAAERLSSASKVYKSIVRRLKDRFSVDDLKLAIDGCHASPWHGGKNDQHKKYQSLDLIVRDAGKVQNFIELAEQHCKDKVDPELEKRVVFLTKLGVRFGLGEPTPDEVVKATALECTEEVLSNAVNGGSTTWSEALAQIRK